MTSKLIVNSIRHTGASADGITMDASGNVTFPGNATCSGTPTGFGGGKIGQVLQTVKTDTFSRNGSSWGDITGFGQDITPSATTSKVLVMVDIKIGADHGDSDYNFKIVRAGTDIYIGDADGNKRRSSMGTASYGMPSNTADGQYRLEQVNLIFLDSPSTTSSINYKLQIINVGGRTNYINRNHHNGNTNNTPRTASSFTVMEVLA